MDTQQPRGHTGQTRLRHRIMTIVLIMVLAAMPQALLAHDEEQDKGTGKGSGNGHGGPEFWVNGQDTSRLFILDRDEVVDTIQLPDKTGPHLTTFSPDGAYAYVAAITAGDMIVIDAESHQIVKTLDLGEKGVHHAGVSPDGSMVIVAQQDQKKLIRVAANPAAGTWDVTGELALPDSPVCTFFVPGTTKAYVSYGKEDLAVVDLTTMTITSTVDTIGQSRCNQTWSKDGNTIYLTSEDKTNGYLYALDPATDGVTLLHTFTGAADLHTPVVSENGKQLHIVGRGNDLFYTVNLSDMRVASFEIGTPGVPDGPDGMVVQGNTAWVNLKASGKVAVVQINQQRASYIDVVAASSNAALNIVERPLGGGGCQHYAETGHSVCGGFHSYWQEFGGLAIFGYPISDAMVTEDGLTVQWFERARFEWHPGSWDERHNVLLGRLGAEQMPTN